MEGIVRTGGADYTGTSQTLPAALGLVQDVFYTNPASGLPWVIGDITAVGFNIGVKSLT